ncbi:hypothetical protein LCGC14_0365090 [marine sediment metagenome]|uniref:Uncharacterized protein n=1 Tax=marine sediment metagenome TaxID=412755 RepID=A0A0F9TPY4_9ZZZZ
MKKIWILGWIISVVLMLISIKEQDTFSFIFSLVFVWVFWYLFIRR